MASFPDLSPCTKFTDAHEGRLIAVGWLSRRWEYKTGDISRGLFNRLCELFASPWEPIGFIGCYDCPFCRFSSGPRALGCGDNIVRLGISNLFVPAGDRLYVAPSLMLHYIDAHGYAPPGEFCDAVLPCPQMASPEYFEEVRRAAPSGLLPEAAKALPFIFMVTNTLDSRLGSSDFHFTCVIYAQSPRQAMDWGLQVAHRYAAQRGFTPGGARKSRRELAKNALVMPCNTPDVADLVCQFGEYPRSLC